MAAVVRSGRDAVGRSEGCIHESLAEGVTSALGRHRTNRTLSREGPRFDLSKHDPVSILLLGSFIFGGQDGLEGFHIVYVLK